MQGDKPDKQPWEYAVNKTVLLMLGQAGCITLVIAAGSLLLGYFLDKQFNTQPWLMVLMIAASVPIALVAVYFRVKAGTAHLLKTPGKKKGISNEEETTSG